VGRWIRIMILAASSIICFAALALWVRSVKTGDTVERYVRFANGQHAPVFGVASFAGVTEFCFIHQEERESYVTGYYWKWTVWSVQQVSPGGGWARNYWFRRYFRPGYLILYVPDWCVVAASAAYPVVYLIHYFTRTRRRRLRLAAGLCIKCGYDLRGQCGRCPECGSEQFPTALAPVPERPQEL
jgi:hypothetical protein